MSPWLETLLVTLVAVLGVCLGIFFSRLPKWYWMAGYVIPFVLLLFLALPHWINFLFFTPPFSWMTAGRREFALGGLVGAMILITPLRRLPQKKTRIAVVVFMCVVVVCYSILPFLGPALIRDAMRGLPTFVDGDGVCRQSNDYNCGPAAAVTVLRKLGLPAEEGSIAIAAHTWFISGTQPDSLSAALEQLYGRQGITAKHRFFKDIGDLKDSVPVIALVKYAFLVDHYVAVLGVSDSEIIIGDPLQGVVRLSHDEFRKRWRYSGIVVCKGEESK